MKNIEYRNFAYLYDKFYSNKNYKKEVEFIKKFINKKDKILDVGCGSGTHAKILFDCGYDINGLDLSPEMIEIANSKIPNHFFVDDILNLKHSEKYNTILSLFAVFNHLKKYKQLKKALINLKHLLKENGKIIIDLHNPQKSGSKTETIDNSTRIMSWKKCNLLKKEFTKITYIVNNKKYKTTHIFKIYDIEKLRKLSLGLGFKKVEFYENYSNITATNLSKNIQMILYT